jgi:hypothetical protein
MPRAFRPALLALGLCLGAPAATAEPMTLDAVLTTTDSISLNFQNDSRRFLTLLQREGSATGHGVFEGARVVEYGMHDVTGGESGEAAGYLEVTTSDGAVAYFRWSLRAVFVAAPDGQATVINSGQWQLDGGTGRFAQLKGVGTLRIEFPSKTERRYLLEGDIAAAQ